jgi:GDPmannose 4,6-dehydratase
MSKKKALITGISGQDGSYLAEFLLELGYEVFGLVRRLSTPENQSTRYENIIDKIELFYGDLNDEISLYNLVDKVRPDEIYNLAAMSHVKISFDQPAFTIKNNSLAVLTLLEAMRKYCPNSKFYQASSSEMFGNSVDDDGFQRMNTPMHPVSPYGCAKLLAYNLTRHYRNAYKLHICNGILFNHESPRRGSNFVTNKIIKTAVEIKKGKKNKLVLGNLDAKRDWGHSYDYVRAMHKILNYEIPMDFIVSTGTTRSVRDLCEITFNKLGLNYLDYVVTDKKYMRPEELKFLCGDSSEIRKVLNWSPKYTFDKMIDEMIEFWVKVVKN